jgi:Bacteriophage capsid protein
MAWWKFWEKQREPMMQARYDAATVTGENARHWAMADGYSADVSMSPMVRRVLRNNARYEVANNSYCRRVILTLAGDCIGTGPRLQLRGCERSQIRGIEDAFYDWALEAGLAEKLRVMRQTKIVDGESFGLLTSNPTFEGPVKLDFTLIDAERVTSPIDKMDMAVDGIEYDSFGNPLCYHVLSEHPGGMVAFTGNSERVRSESMAHWFRVDRPEQHRGISELTPALPLFAQLRRYTLAVLSAAESAADVAIVLSTTAPPADGGEAMAGKPFNKIRFERGMVTTLPDGWGMNGFQSEQPTTTYGDFKREILGEVGGALQVPINIVTGDSSRHNYASGRLDYQVYHRAIRIERSHCERTVLRKIFSQWIAEYAVSRDVPNDVRNVIYPFWTWDGFEHVDPVKEATGQARRLASCVTTLADECAKAGGDWVENLEQIAIERKRMVELGITFEGDKSERENGSSVSGSV